MKLFTNKQYEKSMVETASAVFNDIRTASRRFGNTIFGVSKDGNRDLNVVYGYDQDRSFETYFQTYRLQDIANRVVNAVARSSWRDRAVITIEDKEILKKEMQILDRAKMYIMIERADVLNRIGRFSVLFVGVPDGLPPDTPLGTSTPDKLKDIFFAPYAEDGITITKWDSNPISKRFGMPEIYTLQVLNRGEKRKDLQTKSIRVHWTRIVHMSEGALDGGIEGISSLEPILNRLTDLNKTIGGASEAYFRNARGKYSLEAERGFTGLLSEDAKKDLETEVEAFTNNWKDAMRLAGVKAKVLTTPHSDPVGTVKVALEAISGGTGIPMRILTGEGAGQLAGNEDKESYNQLIGDRQNLVCTDWLTTLLGILKKANMIALPDEFEIKWPVASALNELDQAKVAKDMSEALSNTADAMSTISVDNPNEVFNAVLGIEFTNPEIIIPEPTAPPEPGIEPDPGSPTLQAV